MPQVVCRSGNCAHNLGGKYCNASEIEISQDNRYKQEETDCSTFIPRVFSGSLVVLGIVNYAGLVSQAFSGENLINPTVKCMIASCRFNSGNAGCTAEKIEIQVLDALTSADTLCRMFCE